MRRMYSSFSHTSFPLPRLRMRYIPVWKLSTSKSCLYEKLQHGLELRMCPFLSENQRFPSIGNLSVNRVCWAFHAPFPPTEEQQRTCSSRRNTDTYHLCSFLLLCLPSHIPMEEQHSAVGSAVLLLVLEETVCSVPVFLFLSFPSPHFL